MPSSHNTAVAAALILVVAVVVVVVVVVLVMMVIRDGGGISRGALACARCIVPPARVLRVVLWLGKDTQES